jgi:Ca2+-transporting ATPase
MALSSGIDPCQLREKHPRLRTQYRSEGQNIMMTLHLSDDPRGKIVFATKGSPREVLAMCAFHVIDGKQCRLTDEDRQVIEIANERMAGRAFRVLGFAYAFRDSEMGFTESDYQNGAEYIWLGLVGMADPIREGVKALIAQFHTAGIDTVMITGDQTPTAYAIGKELNLSRGEEMEILDSTQLDDLNPDVLRALSERVPIFSRVSPAHKLQIVQSLQRAGRVVAMTGDGINDGPALKAADVGIAMGNTGTDLAREVADVVLEDDNLQTMIVAISQGRTIYNNIRKAIHYLLATNMSEIMVMSVAIGAGLGQPLNTRQLLWINLISDIFPGLALALEPPEPDVLTKPPRSQEAQILQSSDFKKLLLESTLLSSGALAAYGYGIVRYGIGPRSSTMAFLSLSCGQLLHAISCRTTERSIFGGSPLPPNRYLTGAMAGSFAMQGLAVAVPGLRNLLGITPINVADGVVIAGASCLPFIVNELTKGTGKGYLQ